MPIETDLTTKYLLVMRISYKKNNPEIIKMTKNMLDNGCPKPPSPIELIINEYLESMSSYSSDDIIESVSTILDTL